jgi:MFS family permease
MSAPFITGTLMLAAATLGISLDVLVASLAWAGVQGGPIMDLLNVLQRANWSVRRFNINAEQVIRGLISGCYPVWAAYLIGRARAKTLPPQARHRRAVGVALDRGSQMGLLFVIGVVLGMFLADWYGSWSVPISATQHNLLAANVIARFPAYIGVGLAAIRLQAKKK